MGRADSTAGRCREGTRVCQQGLPLHCRALSTVGTGVHTGAPAMTAAVPRTVSRPPAKRRGYSVVIGQTENRDSSALQMHDDDLTPTTNDHVPSTPTTTDRHTDRYDTTRSTDANDAGGSATATTTKRTYSKR